MSRDDDGQGDLFPPPVYNREEFERDQFGPQEKFLDRVARGGGVPVGPTARTDDPETSREAGWSINTATEVQTRVYWLFKEQGPMTDEELLAAYIDKHGPTPESSPRKRRCDLVAAGIIEDSGDRKLLSTGRRGIVWRLAERSDG